VTLNHGPISGLMPAMRMAFPVQQVELLKGLQVGDVVRFSLQPRGPVWVIATIEPAEDRPPPRPVTFPAPDFALPTTYLLDQVGNVVVREIGGRDWTDGVSQMAVQGLLP